MEQAVTTPVPAGPAKPLWARALDSRFTPPVLITCILLVGNFTHGILESWQQTLIAIVTAFAAELTLGRLVTGKWPHPASAYITGISVGIILRSPYYWPFWLCSLISITSKYVLRVKGRHIWNPSNFGISALLFLGSFGLAALSVQWGNNVWPMVVIWVLGAIIIARLKRFHICATYVVSFVVFAFIRHLVTGDAFLAEVAPITGPPYQLFVFFMITDPKTTVRSKLGQCATVAMVAFVEMLFRLAGNVHAPYYALFLVGPVSNLVEIFLTSRKTPSEPAPAAVRA